MRSLDVAVDGRLGRLLAEVDELADTLTAATVEQDAVDRARDEAAVATLRLDGSPIGSVPEPIGAPPPGAVTGPARGGWLEVLRSGTRELTTVPDEVLVAIEHRGARAGLDATDLAPGLRDDPTATLATLHRRVTDGLLHPTVAGRPRRSEQAVHDASLGRVLFFPLDPAHVRSRVDRLAAWLVATDAHPVVRSGVLHHQLLDIHPYEAANGRVARIAARLSLADDGIDRQRTAQPEEALLADPIGYLDEVARCRRLGDPGSFVTRWAEVILDGLWAVSREVLGVRTEVTPATAAYLRDVGDSAFTLVDHRRAVGGGPGDADRALHDARRAGAVTWLHGTSGLRWRRVAA